jgi:hypothetical protein
MVMPSSISNSEMADSDEPLFVRAVPALRWGAAALLALVLVIAAVAAWELWMRSLGLRTADIGDGKPYWAVERRKIDARPRDQIAIIGDSRILFDTNLDVFQQVAGVRPIQLAVEGTSGLPFLADLADDEHFAGLVVLGIWEDVYLLFPPYPALLNYARTESPSQRAGHWVNLWLQHRLAFLDSGYSLFPLIDQLRLPERPGTGSVPDGYLANWKMEENFADRQTTMWPRFEADPWLRQRQTLNLDTALRGFVDATHGAGFPDAMFSPGIDATRQAIDRIRARGGEVVMVRPPSSGYVREAENILDPRTRVWDRLLRETHSFGVYYADYPDMRDLKGVEESHLGAADQKVFTRAYVTVLCQQVPWMRAHGARCSVDSQTAARSR